MFRRWYILYPFLALIAVVSTALAACGGGASGGTSSNPGSTGSTRPAAVSSPTQPAVQTGDPLLSISPDCLVSMPQLQTLSPTIFALASKPTDDPSTSGVDQCVYGGKTTSSGLLTKFLSIAVLTSGSNGSHTFTTQPGFASASADVVNVNGTSLVVASAQITSGEQNGSWLTLTVGNNGPPLVTWQALKATLAQAETEYTASNAHPSSSPSASTSGNSSGTSAANDVACKLIPTSVISATFPPPDSHGLTAIEMGHGPLKSQVANATDYVCGYDFWAGNVVNQGGAPDGFVLVTLSCGPGAGQDATLTDDNSSPTFTSGGVTSAVGVTRGLGSVGTGSQTVSQVLANAASVAQRIKACG